MAAIKDTIFAGDTHKLEEAAIKPENWSPLAPVTVLE